MRYSTIIRRRLGALLKLEEGSFTVEASLVFPMLFFALIALIMLTLYTYQMVVVYHSASLASERTAFRWDNSARDPYSGIAPTGQYDGLYWRLTDNGALGTLFDFTPEGENDWDDQGIGIVVGNKDNKGEDQGGDGHKDQDSLPQQKMRAESVRIGRPFQGTMRYYGTLEKRVEAKLRQPISILPMKLLSGRSKPSTLSSAAIVDPQELIRNIDLVRYYARKFKGGMNGDQRKQAQTILSGRQALGHG